MKKTLALVLAFALVFSTMTVAFADDAAISADAKVCADLGMLVGDGNGVTAAYAATAPTRIQAAVMVLRLKGLEAEAKAFTGTDNFADANKAAWATPIMAYLKAHPELGWAGDGTNFDPAGAMTAQAYYKVMLETLGYKQTTATVVGDFEYAKTVEFAATKGLTKVAAVANFTVADLAVATVETLKANMKEGGKSLAAVLVEAGKVDKAKAVAAGVYTEAPAAPKVAVDDVDAVGNTSVDVTFEDDVDASAANVANFAIEGLEVKSAALADTDRVRLETAAMTAGKLYTLTCGGKSVKFTAIAKVSGAPEIKDTVGEDIEEVEITFTKHIDFATGSNVANYSIAGVEVAKAVVDGDKVTLTTVGLKNKTKYTVKVTNVKSVDGVNKKADSDSFTSKFDTSAPKIATAVTETNSRLKVTFNEEVTKASAENLANYSIKVDEKDGEALEITSVSWDSDDENFVYVNTEAMENNEDYVISVNGIVDQRKAANTMTRPSTKDFEGEDEDDSAPKVATPVAIAPTKIMVTFTDDSRLDEKTATDLNNYELEDLNIDEISVVQDDCGTMRVLLTVEDMETSKSYDLTIEGVADEFGNAMDETEKSVKATTTSIAAIAPKQVAGVTQVYATDENTIVVVFDGEVDEASAENIANYSVDPVGAPTEAVWEDEDTDIENSVTLTVNDMVNGYTENDRYGNTVCLTIDGVMDLAGNKLYYEEDVNTSPATDWDEDAPEIQDAEAVDTNVVAVTFDEQVRFVEGATALELLINGDDHHVLTLPAAGYSDEDTVVEFTYANGLDDSVEYTVYRIVYNDDVLADGSLSDMIGNEVLQSTLDEDELVSFDGSDDEHSAVEIDSYYQKDARTFEVTMEKEVNITATQVTVGNKLWDVTRKGSNHTIIRLTLNDPAEIIHEDTDYNFDFASMLADKHGYAVANVDDVNNDDTNDATVLTGEYTDEDRPYVDDVAADSRTYIKVTFSERMDSSSLDKSDFSLKNYDLDEDITITGSWDDAANDNVFYLIVTKPLEARYEYQLTIDKTGVKDRAGLTNADEDSFYFNGSNLKHLD